MKVNAVALPALALAVLAGPALAQTEPRTTTDPQQPDISAQGTSAQAEPATRDQRMGVTEFVPQDRIVISGTVVSSREGALVIRSDDHRHNMRFDVAQAKLPQDLKRGQRVRVAYHATGPIGQAADQVETIDRTAGVQQQASLRLVQGSESDAAEAQRFAQRENAEWRRRTGGTPTFAGGAQEGTTTATGAGTLEPQDRDREDRGTTTGTNDTDRTMPATASALPLMTLSGFGALLTGLVLLRSRREA
jgi:hypothetical protein